MLALPTASSGEWRTHSSDERKPHPLVAGELERIKRADAPLRERSRCLTLVRTKVSYRTLHPEHLPQVLPLSDPCLSLALPAGGGGA